MSLTQQKILVHQSCLKIIGNRISELTLVLKDAQNSANNETKSSAGDKHETGRAMAQLETEKLTTQLTEALKLEEALSKINVETTHQKVTLGSLVITNNGNFYIAISLGKIEVNNTSYYAISAVSPIGKQLIGLAKNDSFLFNERNYTIKNVA